MATINAMRLQECSSILRKELKEWEQAFAAANGGRKAGRDDIKADAAIAKKYKAYNALREQIAQGEPVRETTVAARALEKTRKRPAENDASKQQLSPSKRRSPVGPSNTCLASTTTATSPSDRAKTSQGTPSSSHKLDLTPRHVRTMLGPTPQRDGLVLGLFDMLPTETTPSKHAARTNDSSRTALSTIEANLLRTPSRRHVDGGCGEDGFAPDSGGRQRGERTPTSSGKRYLLDTIVTPIKRRKIGSDGTPSSSSKNPLATPRFLRRDMPVIMEDGIDEDADGRSGMDPPRPWNRRLLGRSLSSMIQSLRKQEEEQLDDELDIMRELEQDEERGTSSASAKPAQVQVQMQDSQHVTVLDAEGFNNGSDSDEDQEAGPKDDGRKPTRWKKKGQKRQTRRVIMRPNKSRPKPQQVEEPSNTADEHPYGDVVAETQVVSTGVDVVEDAVSDIDEPDDLGAEHDGDSEGDQDSKRKPAAQTSSGHRTKDTEATESKVKKGVRKVTAYAHANFRKLKIKNKNSKAKGRFGRSRR